MLIDKCILFSAIFAFVRGANILGVFDYPSYSHQIVFQSLVKALSDRGHHLTILTADRMNSNHPNITEIFLENSYDININFMESRGLAGLNLARKFVMGTLVRNQQQLSLPKVQELIKNHQNYHFDLLITEHLFGTPFLAFSELYDCPVIGICAIELTTNSHELMGNEVNPALHPEVTFPFEHGNLNIFERITSFIAYIGIKFIFKPIFVQFGHDLIKKNFENSSRTKFEHQDVDLMFTNTNPALGYIRPLTPNTIQLGSLHVKPPKPIADKNLLKLLDSSVKGVIFMSLGSNVKSKDMSDETKNIFLNVFRKLPYQILWKFEDDLLINKSENIRISKWFPQSDLLAHPNVKLFISQGGLMSLEEAIDRETPLILFPCLLDQNRNALKAQEENFGLKLDIDDLTEAKLFDAINEVMKPKYKENIMKFKQVMNDQPMTGIEKAVWWTEYVIRNKGAKHLKYPGRKIPFYQKIHLDIILTFFIIFYVAKKLFAMKYLSCGSEKPKKD